MSRRMSELSKLDLYDEDGYREWTKTMIGIHKDLQGEIAFGAQVLYQVLAVTPVSNPRTGILGAGDDSKHYARKVRTYLNRARQSNEFAAGQIAGAWSQFENGFLVPSNSRQRGMTISSTKK